MKVIKSECLVNKQDPKNQMIAEKDRIFMIDKKLVENLVKALVKENHIKFTDKDNDKFSYYRGTSLFIMPHDDVEEFLELRKQIQNLVPTLVDKQMPKEWEEFIKYCLTLSKLIEKE